MKSLISRAGPSSVALETTLLLHGVPRGQGAPLAAELAALCRAHGADPALVGVVRGIPTVGLTDAELHTLLEAPKVPKANTSNLGMLIFTGQHAATTVSTTMELAAAAGVRVFATGGLGGVHFGYATHLDISADLAAFTRFPVAVVTAGVKSILDVTSTREALETLGVPVVGYKTDHFPAFYLRQSHEKGAAKVDARFDDISEMARYIKFEMARTGRGIVVANPIPEEDELPRHLWEAWLAQAQRETVAAGRDATPALLGALHRLSNGRTLAANIALVKHNTLVAAQLAVSMSSVQSQ